jgi:hypothetical protein
MLEDWKKLTEVAAACSKLMASAAGQHSLCSCNLKDWPHACNGAHCRLLFSFAGSVTAAVRAALVWCCLLLLLLLLLLGLQ